MTTTTHSPSPGAAGGRRTRRTAAAIATARLVAGLLAGVLAATGTTAAAASDQNTNQSPPPFMGGRPGGPGGPLGMLPMFSRSLQLTDAQKDQLKSIAQAHSDEWKALAARAQTAHSALNSAVTADTVDETLIRQKSADVAVVDADMAVARAQAYAEAMQVLTADQKTQLKALQAQFNARRSSPRGPR